MADNEGFWVVEANRYFERNRVKIEEEGAGLEDVNELLRMLGSHDAEISQILEVGCSSGRKLEKLCEGFRASGVGIEPGALAVEEGNRRLRERQASVELLRGFANNLPFPPDSFDLVILGFFLYVEGRQSLLKSLTEADRVTRPGGFLVIRDFAPEFPHSRGYAHEPDISVFKNNYANFFLSLGHYVLISTIPFDRFHRVGFELNPDFREQLNILHKKSEPYPLR